MTLKSVFKAFVFSNILLACGLCGIDNCYSQNRIEYSTTDISKINKKNADTLKTEEPRAKIGRLEKLTVPERLRYSDFLASDTSGMFVYRPVQNKYSGGAETSYTIAKYDAKFGDLGLADEEKLVEICENPFTEIISVSKPSVTLPGQYIATEIVTSFDYQMAIAQLELQEGFNRKDETLAKRKELLDVHLKKMEMLYAGGKDLSDPKVRKEVVKNIIDGGSFIHSNIMGLQKRLYNTLTIRRKAENFLDLYILRKNYDPNIDMTKINARNIEKLPGINKVLYDLAAKYHGQIYLPNGGDLESRPFSTGGVHYIRFNKEGIIVNGALIKGLKKETADALRLVVAKSFICKKQNNKDREAQIQKYVGKINEEGYPFSIYDYKRSNFEHQIFRSNVTQAADTKNQFLQYIKSQIDYNEAKYNYYQKIKRLP